MLTQYGIILGGSHNYNLVASFPQSGKPAINLASPELWTINAAGSNTNGKSPDRCDFIVNGDGNFREIRTDPWGNRALVWVTKNNDNTSDADGGWNKVIPKIDPNKKHLSFVYFRRVSDSTNGRWCHGCGSIAWGAENSTSKLSDALDTNPYFSYPLLANEFFSKNQWYLAVGLIHEHSYTGLSTGLAGIYQLNDGRKIYEGTEYKQVPDKYTQMHRTYLYYSTDPLVEIEWWYPGFYAIDGTEPTLSQLLRQ